MSTTLALALAWSLGAARPAPASPAAPVTGPEVCVAGQSCEEPDTRAPHDVRSVSEPAPESTGRASVQVLVPVRLDRPVSVSVLPTEQGASREPGSLPPAATRGGTSTPSSTATASETSQDTTPAEGPVVPSSTSPNRPPNATERPSAPPAPRASTRPSQTERDVIESRGVASSSPTVASETRTPEETRPAPTSPTASPSQETPSDPRFPGSSVGVRRRAASVSRGSPRQRPVCGHSHVARLRDDTLLDAVRGTGTARGHRPSGRSAPTARPSRR